METKILSCEQERQLALELARSNGFDKTLAAIEDPKNGIETILNTAYSESKEKGTTGVLIKNIINGPYNWAQAILHFIPELTDGKEELLNKISSDTGAPRQIGWGYNTYFVNQTGKQIWVMYNTGLMGGSGPFTGPRHLNKGQNVGWGRGGTCITNVNVWPFEPSGWFDQGLLGTWSLPQGANACKSWGFRIDANGIAEAIQGDSMPDKYPPSNGEPT